MPDHSQRPPLRLSKGLHGYVGGVVRGAAGWTSEIGSACISSQVLLLAPVALGCHRHEDLRWKHRSTKVNQVVTHVGYDSARFVCNVLGDGGIHARF